MKKIFTLFLLWFLFIWSSIEAFADTHVKWYYRKNWTYVKPHYRSDRNNTKADNWSTKWNINPYTGKIWTKNIYWTENNYNYTPKYNTITPTYDTSCSDIYWGMSYEKNWKCYCMKWYTLWINNKCILKRDYCVENFWLWATYNYIMNQCECSAWYEIKDNECVRTADNTEEQSLNTITERIKIAIWIMNFDTNLRKTPWINWEKIRIVRKGEYVYFSKEKSVKIWNHYWTTVMTWNKEVGYMITDTIDFVQDYAE